MVDAGERGSDEARQDNGSGVKYPEPNDLVGQQDIAYYGKAALYPVCQAALILWSFNTELDNKTRGVFPSGVSNQDGSGVEATVRRWRAEEAYLRKFLSEMPGEPKGDDRETIRVLLKGYETRADFVDDFVREYKAANSAALKALRRVFRKMGALKNQPRPRLKIASLRKLEILNFLHTKRLRAAFATAGHDLSGDPWSDNEWQPTEQELGAHIGTLSDPLCNSEWQGRLTAREIHFRLVTAGLLTGETGKEREELHEIRRIARKLGIRLAEDVRGPKRKPMRGVNKKPKQPRTKPELEFTGDIDQVLSELCQKSQGKARPSSYNQFWDTAEAQANRPS
jgi:hypothetical protein